MGCSRARGGLTTGEPVIARLLKSIVMDRRAFGHRGPSNAPRPYARLSREFLATFHPLKAKVSALVRKGQQDLRADK